MNEKKKKSLYIKFSLWLREFIYLKFTFPKLMNYWERILNINQYEKNLKKLDKLKKVWNRNMNEYPELLVISDEFDKMIENFGYIYTSGKIEIVNSDKISYKGFDKKGNIIPKKR